MRHRLSLVLLCCLGMLLAACGTPSTPSMPATPVTPVAAPNRPPVIHSLRASSDTVYAGNPVRFQLETSDPDGDWIDVRWSTVHGTVTSADGFQASWEAPPVPGVHFIQVEVVDRQGARVVGSKQVTVQDRLTVPAGTTVLVRTLAPINGETVRVGDRFPIEVVERVRHDGYTVVNPGAYGVAQVVRLPRGEDQTVPSAVSLAITQIQLADGQSIPLDAVELPPTAGEFEENWPRSVLDPGPEAGLTGLRTTSFRLLPGEETMIPAGTVFAGMIRHPVEMFVFGDEVVPSAVQQPVPVTTEPCIGIEGVDFSEIVLTVYTDGIRVERFIPGSTAEKSGLQIGDRIAGVKIRGTEYPLASMRDLRMTLQHLDPGEEIILLVRNVLRKIDVPVRVESCYVVR